MDMDLSPSARCFLTVVYVVFVFCSTLCLGALKGLLVGPIACLILVIGNVGVILGLSPAHVWWTVYTITKTNRFDTPLKIAILFALPALVGLWLGLSIGGSVLAGVGYGFFTPWSSTFDAFRHDNGSKKFIHVLLDGTLGTIKGSCTVVRDFADLCFYSFPSYLEELRQSPASNEHQPLRFIHVPACILVGVMGLLVEIPSYTLIAVIKSPYMLFKGWFRLVHDLISREGPFLETACIPVAGLAIITWPIVVIASILTAVFSSIFIGLYGSVVVYQERSFWRGLAYVIAMVAEFDEYTNDWLYLQEGTILPKPQYRKKESTHGENSIRGDHATGAKFSSVPTEAPAMLVPSLAPSRSVRDAIQEVKMVQIWGHMMKVCELRGRDLLDTDVITLADLREWLKAKNESEAAIVSYGLPCYALLQSLLHSIRSASDGLMLVDGIEITYLNRPKDKLLDWFFHPVMVLKEQIAAIKLEEGEVRFLEKVLLFGSDRRQMEAWDSGGLVPEDALRAAQIQGISRRMIGIVRSVSKFPTFRRVFRHLVKNLVAYSKEKEGLTRSNSEMSVGELEDV